MDKTILQQKVDFLDKKLANNLFHGFVHFSYVPSTGEWIRKAEQNEQNLFDILT